MARTTAKKSNLSEFELLDEVEHVLKRPGMYLGDVRPRTSVERVLEDGRFVEREVTYSPGLVKLFDEIVTNSVDEHVRNGRLNRIDVTVTRHDVSVSDNGGIPVQKHPKHGVLIPEMVFSNLRAGVNFDDTGERVVAGTHGLGSTLTNIFSTRFEVRTCDGKKSFVQGFSDNMSSRTKPEVRAHRRRGTTVTFAPDLARFGAVEIDDDACAMMRRRVADLAACNPGVRFTFNGEPVAFGSFAHYAAAHCEVAASASGDGWDACVGRSDSGFRQTSFVNSAETKDGGTHVDRLVGQVVDELRASFAAKHKADVRPADVRSQLHVVVRCTVPNPTFTTQTKERMVTPVPAGSMELPKAFHKAVFESPVASGLLDLVQAKADAEERAQLRKMNKAVKNARVVKLIDAKGQSAARKTLGIFEGQSAMSAVRRFRDPATFGAFPLRGKFLNVSEMKPTAVARNAEATDLMASVGLRMGEPPDGLRYGKVVVYTDADTDGSSIFCLLLNFLARFWPELFDRGVVYRALTPLAVAKKGKQKRYIYTMAELGKGLKGWEIDYKKGLAALEDDEYREIIQNPVLVRVDRDAAYRESLRAWFGPDSAPRKERLKR